MDLVNLSATTPAASGMSAILFGTLLANLTKTFEQLVDPGSNYPADASDRLQERYDFVVVGAGSAGSVVAARLSENPQWSVLLLEAGGDPPPDAEVPALFFGVQTTAADWAYVTEPEPHSCRAFVDHRCPIPRGKLLGGSGAINAMMYMPGNRLDYDEWESLGNKGWSYEDVLPYYKKSQNLRIKDLLKMKDADAHHSTEGPQTLTSFEHHPLTETLLDSAAELGYGRKQDFRPDDQFGFGETLATIRDGKRCSSAKAFLGQAKNRKNLHVLKNALATNILIDQDNNRAYGIQFEKGRSMHKVIAEKEIIVSAGTINSPQLLMLSGIGPKEILETIGRPVIQNLKVGENFHDHNALFSVLFAVNTSSSTSPMDAAFTYLSQNDGPLSGVGVCSVSGFIKTNKRPEDITPNDRPDIQTIHFMFEKSNPQEVEVFTKAMRFNDDMKSFLRDAVSKSDILVMIPVLLHPKSRGRIVLKSADPHEAPLIYSGFFSDPDDVEVLADGALFATARGRTAAMQAVGATPLRPPLPACADLEFESKEYWKCVVRQVASTLYHPVGSCRMGPRGEGGVVDERLRVYGVSGLRVADASVIPTITSGNTHAPAIMIGERVADMIKEDWR